MVGPFNIDSLGMRLLKTGLSTPGDDKLEIVQIWARDIPAYAILSHTWSANPDDEVLLSDVQNGTYDRKPAYTKLKKALDRARLDGWDWLWVDTCCIDKTSSAELSEAINSMYAYYKNSEICYAYLADVESEMPGAKFQSSRWWKRGWTLQELLAPRLVEFFNTNWKSIGFKHILHEATSRSTEIESPYLTGALPIEQASIAKRMSWAASRETTRGEDVAYSLMGLFNVNMPMLYGEGSLKAFIRLQEEIMRADEDQSLFAWVSDEKSGLHGLLADSPRDFERTGNVLSYTERGDKPSILTARGLHVTLPLTHKSSDRVIAALHCPKPGGNYSDWLAVYLQPLDRLINQYARVECDKLASVVQRGVPQEIYVHQGSTHASTAQTEYPNHYFQIRSMEWFSEYRDPHEYKIVQFVGEDIKATMTEDQFLRDAPPSPEPQPWSLVPLVYTIEKKAGSLTMALRVERIVDEEAFVIMLGASSDLDIGVTVTDTIAFEPGCTVSTLQNCYHPRPLGTFVDLRYHSVRVSSEELVRVKYNQKVYVIDIEIKSIPKSPTAKAILKGAIDSVVPGQGRGAARTDFVEMVKRRLVAYEKKKEISQHCSVCKRQLPHQPHGDGRVQLVARSRRQPNLVPSRFEQSHDTPTST